MSVRLLVCVWARMVRWRIRNKGADGGCLGYGNTVWLMFEETDWTRNLECLVTAD